MVDDQPPAQKVFRQPLYGGTSLWKYARESGEDCSKSIRFD